MSSAVSSNLPTKSQILSLFRDFLRNSKKFEDYNFREYFLRKTRNDFKKLQKLNEKNKKEASDWLIQAQSDLALLRRQATISKMYHFDKLVVEKLNSKHVN